MTPQDGRALLDTVLSQLESDMTTLDSLERARGVKPTVEAWCKENPDELVPEQVRWEICALDLFPSRRQSGASGAGPRFGPVIAIGGSRYPDVEALMADERAIAYYKRRAQETGNPIQRARYADILWEALRSRGADDAFTFGELAVDSYLEVARLCLSLGDLSGHTLIIRGIELGDSLTRASEIAQQLNSRELAADVVAGIRMALSGLAGGELYRWVIDLAHILLRFCDSRFRDLVPQDLLDQIRTICTEGIAYHDGQDQRNLNILDDLMRLSSDISRRLGDGTDSWRMRVEMARSWEEQAARRQSGAGGPASSLVAFKFAEEALHRYQSLCSIAPDEVERSRMQREVERTKQEVRRLMRQAEDEMKELSVSADLSAERREALVAPFLSAEPGKVFERFSLLLPDPEQLHEQADKAAKQYVFSSIFPRMTLRNGRKVDETAAFDGYSVQYLLQLEVWFQIHVQLLDHICWRLKQEGLLTPESLLEHIEGWPLVEERDLPFVRSGVERYFAEDWVGAVHVLAPRIEPMIKGVFERAGLSPMVVPDDRRIREQTFGEFLAREEVRAGLGERIWLYIDYALVDGRGPNLRNEVAHGWIQQLECNQITTEVLLFIVLILTGLKLVESADHSDESSKT